MFHTNLFFIILFLFCLVPFFGDQGFWGSMVHTMGVGPAPIPFKNLNVNKFSAAIEFALQSPVVYAARNLGNFLKYIHKPKNSEKKEYQYKL